MTERETSKRQEERGREERKLGAKMVREREREREIEKDERDNRLD